MRSLLLAIIVLAAASAHAGLTGPAQKCERAAASALQRCLVRFGAREGTCYLATGATCAPNDAGRIAATTKLERKIRSTCRDDATVQAVGWGPALTQQALVDRMREACLGAHASLAARTFGGPHAAVLAAADDATRSCLAVAHAAATDLIAATVKQQSGCIERTHRGKRCNLGRLDDKLTAAEADAESAVAAACPDLATPIGLDAAAFLSAASAQARCLTATAHTDSGLLSLDCGPRASVPVPPRGQWIQIVLDEATWGTRCGDGSPYAFWLRLAPTGSPLEHVAIDLQGGGVCVFPADCQSVPADLFSALDDGEPSEGYLDTNPAINPFSDWTMAFLPYCTQDVHLGNGTTSAFPGVTVYRFGGRNVRGTLRYLRDVLWTAIDGDSAEGFRPDRLTVLFAGESAGAFGVDFNYHYLLDDLGWSHTTAAPDSGLGLDNGQVLGVSGLGVVAQSPAPPFGWDTRPLQPPYCLASGCAVGPVLDAATAPRLKAVPEQQILNISNQVDDAQVSTTFFPDVPSWTNALRAAYCTTRGLNGIHFFYPASSTPTHTMLRTNSRYTGLLAGGVSPAQYLADAFADPDGVVDRVDEGTLQSDYPGVLPFPCP
ncbi:MAG TPA: pectin acetylesterase-family hydrolase [Candidatus Eisenbacteria bacterium]|nr:pectin acetylesterase-family hydrolase [Candidatus Eisenbacteria bacterium]